MVKALKKAGIRGEVLSIRANAGDLMVNDLIGPGKTITQNGFHMAVRVGDTVFDNFFREGVSYEAFVNALNAPGGVTITSTPF
jgi:hypothetical protein